VEFLILNFLLMNSFFIYGVLVYYYFLSLDCRTELSVLQPFLLLVLILHIYIC